MTFRDEDIKGPALDEASDYALDLLARLVAQPSVRGTVSDVQMVVEAELCALGMVVGQVAVDAAELTTDPEWSPPTSVPGRIPLNLVGRWPGSTAAPTLFAHVDTEPVGDPDAWETPPFEAVVRGDRMYGLGVADDKAGLASIVAALQVLQRLGREIEGLTMLSVHGKQGGSLGTLPVWRSVGSATAALYCHPAETGRGLADLKIASHGILSFELEVQGLTPPPNEIRTPASADPRAGINAVELAQRVLDELRAWAAGGADPDRVLAVTAIEAGGDPFTVPDRCRLAAAVWFRGGTVGELEASLREHLERSSAADPWLRDHPPSVSLVGIRANPAEVAPDHPLVRLVSRSIERVTGSRPRLYAGHAASDIRFPIRCCGVPSVGFGPRAGNFYGANEWVDLASMRSTVEILVRALADLAPGSR